MAKIHLRRELLPWRGPELYSYCGKKTLGLRAQLVAEFLAVCEAGDTTPRMVRAAVSRWVKQAGRVPPTLAWADEYCTVCVETYNRFSHFATDPIGTMIDACQSSSAALQVLMAAELQAMEVLVASHPEEFEALVRGGPEVRAAAMLEAQDRATRAITEAYERTEQELLEDAAG